MCLFIEIAPLTSAAEPLVPVRCLGSGPLHNLLLLTTDTEFYISKLGCLTSHKSFHLKRSKVLCCNRKKRIHLLFMKAVLHVKGYLDEPKPLNKAVPFSNGREMIEGHPEQGRDRARGNQHHTYWEVEERYFQTREISVGSLPAAQPSLLN